MKLSFWNQHFRHTEIVNSSHENTYVDLIEYYKKINSNINIENTIPNQSFSFSRGSSIVSALGLGSEVSCKHFVKINIKSIDNDKSEISWEINLKLFGFQAGSNALIEECKDFARNANSIYS